MKLLLSLLVVAIGAQPAIAGDGHNHEASVEQAPQGGILRDCPPLKCEINFDKKDPDLMKLSVYSDKLKVIKYDAPTFKGEIEFPREKRKPITFTRKKEPKPKVIKDVGEVIETYEAKIAGISKKHRYDLHVKVAVEGKNGVADFGVDNIN